MKTIGLIGGMSWFSTITYYRTINQLINQRLGGSHSAKILLYSVDFNEFKILQEKDDLKAIGLMISGIAQRLENAGADCILICSNTPHIIADRVQENIKIPLLNIAEETAKVIARQKITSAGLLGTKFTMEQSFFKDRLSAYGIETIIPDTAEREIIHASVFNELTKGIYSNVTKNKYIEIISKLQANGAEGIIFGCTEIALLINQSDCSLPVFETSEIHAKAAVEFALL